MDVWEYFNSRERECKKLSLVPDPSIEDMCAAEAGSNGQRGTIFGRLGMTERAFLNIYESIVVEGSGIHREEYSYYLIHDGAELWGFDRDPSHEPAEHGHEGSDHKRIDTGSVTFHEAASKAWDTVTQEEELAAEGH